MSDITARSTSGLVHLKAKGQGDNGTWQKTKVQIAGGKELLKQILLIFPCRITLDLHFSIGLRVYKFYPTLYLWARFFFKFPVGVGAHNLQAVAYIGRLTNLSCYENISVLTVKTIIVKKWIMIIFWNIYSMLLAKLLCRSSLFFTLLLRRPPSPLHQRQQNKFLRRQINAKNDFFERTQYTNEERKELSHYIFTWSMRHHFAQN